MLKTLIIVECPERAGALQRELDPFSQKYVVIALGAYQGSQRYELVIVSHAAHVMMNNPDISSRLKVAVYQEWYKTCVLTRLVPDGKVIQI